MNLIVSSIVGGVSGQNGINVCANNWAAERAIIIRNDIRKLSNKNNYLQWTLNS